MRILVIGSGGREHALVWKLRQNPEHAVFVAPGNGGTAGVAQNVPIAVDAITELVDFARREKMDLAVPGPELPLTLGIADAMKRAGIPCFGPDAYCARLEGSKRFAKEIMAEAGVPTAACAAFTDIAAAKDHVRKQGAPLVIKADGLAAGKGVVVARSLAEALAALDEMMEKKVHGAAANTVLIEECLQGEEVSFLCLCDGKDVLPLPSAQDHKAVFDGDSGPNTGGMGAYSPAPLLPDHHLERMADLVVRPVAAVMAGRGHPFVGVLYAGLMMTADGPKVLEYNVRFGDPECQPLLMRLESDLAQLMLACVEGRISRAELVYRRSTALGVVLCARGYPGAYPKGMEISGLEELGNDGAVKDAGVVVFHSGTVQKAGKIFSSGGRVLCVAALGDGLAAAQRNAYAGLEKIRMADGFYRRDIGAKGITFLQSE
ncbi:MAG: phosphoribosylamine--glycine ligase [Deltaproteobacteria bacterium]|nr:phosphoribosylamine--glycine ligase [Deltaproteobacteria bacterium]